MVLHRSYVYVSEFKKCCENDDNVLGNHMFDAPHCIPWCQYDHLLCVETLRTLIQAIFLSPYAPLRYGRFKYETVSTELWTKIKPDLTRPKISSGIDWDGLFELKMQS